MNRYFAGPTVNQVLPVVLRDLLANGHEVGSRNGRVKEMLNAKIMLEAPDQREVLCLNRGANVFAQIAETMWVLRGRGDIGWLSAYLPRAKDYSDDGQVWRGAYGPRIRGWGQQYDDSLGEVDQLAYVVDVLKKDPLSRQAVIAIYDPATDNQPGLDRPCNTFLQFQSRLGVLHMTVTVRSNDAMWGWSGINAFEWSTLHEIVASLLNINIGSITFNIGSLHLYEQHWDKASRIEENPVSYYQIPFDSDGTITTLAEVDRLIDRWFIWEQMCRDGDATPDELEDFGESMFRAWAAAIAYYWTRERRWLDGLEGTALAAAIAMTPATLLPEPPVASRSSAAAHTPTPPPRDAQAAFYAFVTDLHAKKHASYGDSWKKRGELMSILPNIARKIDRLGIGDEFDTSADTVIDLWVYLAKYRCWLVDLPAGPDNVNILLAQSMRAGKRVLPDWQIFIPKAFNAYADCVAETPREHKVDWVTDLLETVAPIAFEQWYLEQEYRGADAD